ncbi:hypothetical protein SH449x_000948 [Pirellulaceae bacterium SH449]
MQDLFDDPATIGQPKKRTKKSKATATERAVYDPDKDRELSRVELNKIWAEHAAGYTVKQIALAHKLPLKRTEYAISIDRHWYIKMLERLDLIGQYGKEQFDFVGQEMNNLDRDDLPDVVAGIPASDAQRIWALQYLQPRPSDLLNANWIDPEVERQQRAYEERRKAYSYWKRKLNCSDDVAELVRRTAAGEPFPEFGHRPDDEESPGDESIFDALFGSNEEPVIGSEIDDYLPQDLIDQCNKSIAQWLETRSIAFADAVRRKLWKYHQVIATRKAYPRVPKEPQVQPAKMRRYLEDADD